MTDAIAATGVALFTALDGAVTGADVHQHVPEDAPLPVVIIGDIEGAKPLGRAGDPDQAIPVAIVAVTEGEARSACTDLVGQVIALLDGKTFAQDGFTVAPTLESWSAGLAEDGLGYIGTALFTVFALKN